MFPIIEVSGSAYERGKQYGTAAAMQTRHSIRSYAELFAYRLGLNWHVMCDKAQAYAKLIENTAPALMDEMRGVADGADVDLMEVVALNARTELLAGIGTGTKHANAESAIQQNEKLMQTDMALAMNECTAVAALPSATKNKHTLLAQTWDWMGNQRAACVVLRAQGDDGADYATITEGGMLAKIGLNQHGIAVTLNILASKSDGKKAGFPVHLILRSVLNQKDFESAERFIHSIAPSASSCITIASAEGKVASFEVTPTHVVAMQPRDGVISHTNHCMAELTQGDECAISKLSSTKERISRADTLLSQQRGKIDEVSLIQILRDESDGEQSICRHPNMQLPTCDRVETVLGAVMNTTTRTIDIADDVPSRVSFERISL